MELEAMIGPPVQVMELLALFSPFNPLRPHRVVVVTLIGKGPLHRRMQEANSSRSFHPDPGVRFTCRR
jgi:hypothetical protein